MRLDWQSAEVANAHVEKDCNEGNVGDERDEEYEFGVGELVHDSSFLLWWLELTELSWVEVEIVSYWRSIEIFNNFYGGGKYTKVICWSGCDWINVVESNSEEYTSAVLDFSMNVLEIVVVGEHGMSFLATDCT